MQKLGQNIYTLLLFGLVLPLIGSALSISFFSSWRLDNHALHAIIEVSGAIFAFILINFLLQSKNIKEHFSKNEIILIASALLSMGILDIFHAFAPVGNNFVWLHSLATFSGGLLFASVSFSKHFKEDNIFFTKLPFAFFVLSMSLGVISFAFQGYIPTMIHTGEFTFLARFLNIVGGLGFMAATIYFYRHYVETKRPNYYLLSAHCLLFGSAGILFEVSALWDAAWWWWHILRFAAYLVLVFLAVEGMTKQVSSYSLSFSYAYTKKILAAFLVFIASLVIFGWHTENSTLIQINPSFAPMQYNTALGFLIAGLGIIALSNQTNWARIACGTFVTLLGLLTLTQYIFSISLGIDELLMEAYINTKVSHPGRMAPNTALCFSITGLLLLVYRNNIALFGLIGSLVLLSTLALIGYMIDAEGLYGIGSMTRMALHTAIGFLIIATVFFLITKKDRQTQFDIWTVSPFIAATILSLATLLAWQTSREFTIATNKSYFNKLVEEKINVIEERFSLYEHALKGGTGLFNASEHVSRNEWYNYVEAVNPTQNLPGTNGIGYIEYVDEKDLPTFLEQTRADGAPDFKNHPKTNFSDKYIIKYIEPTNINGPAIGLDIGFEAHRREGVIRARDTGKTSLTKIIFLVQDNKKLSGFLLLSPVYEKNQPINTIEQRRKHFLGMVYSPFMGRKFMADIYEISDQSINFEVYDGDEIKEAHLIYKENNDPSAKDFAYLKATTKTEFAGRVWTINWRPNVNFTPKIHNDIPEIILIIGTLITLLFSWLFHLLGKLYGTSARQLEVNRVKLDNIITNMVDGLIVIDAKGAIEIYNPACETLFGYKAKEVIGKNIKMLMPEKYSKKHDDYLKTYDITGEKKIIGTGREVEGQHKNGTIFSLELAISELTIAGEKLYTGIIRDITERKKAEEKLQKANKELESFTYIASHDLRSPLINLKGYSAQLEKYIGKIKPIVANTVETLPDDETETINNLFEKRIPEAVNFINNGVEKIDSMTNAILQLSRTGRRELKFTDIHTNALVEKCANIVQHQLKEKNGEIIIDDLPDIVGDMTAIEQIFSNLIDNAVKYLSDDRPGKIEISAISTEDAYRFEIKDNGRGIDEQDFDKVFAIFRRAGSAIGTDGEGMGLNYVRSLIQRHGGDINFTSTRDEGTTFTFTISVKPPIHSPPPS